MSLRASVRAKRYREKQKRRWLKFVEVHDKRREALKCHSGKTKRNKKNREHQHYWLIFTSLGGKFLGQYRGRTLDIDNRWSGRYNPDVTLLLRLVKLGFATLRSEIIAWDGVFEDAVAREKFDIKQNDLKPETLNRTSRSKKGRELTREHIASIRKEYQRELGKEAK